MVANTEITDTLSRRKRTLKNLPGLFARAIDTRVIDRALEFHRQQVCEFKSSNGAVLSRTTARKRVKQSEAEIARLEEELARIQRVRDALQDGNTEPLVKYIRRELYKINFWASRMGPDGRITKRKLERLLVFADSPLL